jgi:hypothetical protein
MWNVLDDDLAYQLDLRAQELCLLCITWQGKLRPIPADGDECWGPSEDELKKVAEFEFNLSLEDDSDTEREGRQSCGSDSGEDWAGVEQEGSDGDLIESLDALAFSDEYRNEAVDAFPNFGDFSTDMFRASSSSPTKRPRGLSP